MKERRYKIQSAIQGTAWEAQQETKNEEHKDNSVCTNL